MSEDPALVNWTLVFTRQAAKDAKKLARSGLRGKAESILAILRRNPFQAPPPFEKLVGDLAGAYSRRINIQHRIVYEVTEKQRVEPASLLSGTTGQVLACVHPRIAWRTARIQSSSILRAAWNRSNSAGTSEASADSSFDETRSTILST
jgi:Txe/YoeB family toxin of toxin-antitoxin system